MWYPDAMQSAMDKAGRVIIPAPIRARLGWMPGPVDITVDGAGVHIAAIAPNKLAKRDGRVVIAADGPPLSADDIRDLRLANQR
ncbi:MAG: AbrB/MazE/SpoVT family DNA-binding domain-containing protein [Burkholderiaceae bacterium]|jgi:AbrB family looped-hinge helix DNA binding protein|nr:AbrB/MazE/SpoVT family DNA-binding domain-containing protein [Burkholderiaceae bacterium]